jgi:hypothetical protein
LIYNLYSSLFTSISHAVRSAQGTKRNETFCLSDFFIIITP